MESLSVQIGFAELVFVSLQKEVTLKIVERRIKSSIFRAT